MIYYLDDEKIDIDVSKLKLLGAGKEGSVYKYKNQAFKICKYDSLTKKDCIELKELNTERILLPKKIIYNDKNEYCGYTTDYCKKKNIFYITKQLFIYELNKLIEEISYLSENKVFLSDWHYDNFIYDDKFKFVDPGQYLIAHEYRKPLYEFNYNYLCYFIANEFLKNIINNDILSYNLLEKVYHCSKEDIIKFYSSEIKNNETIYQYSKRIAKSNKIVL